MSNAGNQQSAFNKGREIGEKQEDQRYVMRFQAVELLYNLKYYSPITLITSRLSRCPSNSA